LSEQELNVLRLAAEGLSNPQIGARLFLSRHTVKEYLSNAMRKLGARGRLEAVMKASQHGLIEGPVAGPGGRGATLALHYNDPSTPIRVSELKVTPIKVGALERKSPDVANP